MTDAQPQFDVFLIHNTKDKQSIRYINEKLKRSHLKTWLDEEKILAGQIIQDKIQEVIPQIKSAAIFIGIHGLGRWQKVEIRSFYSQCVENNIIIIPVLLPGVSEIPPSLVFLKEHKWVKFAHEIEDKKALAELKLAIRQRRLTSNQIRLNKQQSTLNAISKSSTYTAYSGRKTKLNAGSSSTTRVKVPARKNISNSGAWVLLKDKIFLTKSVETQADKSVTLHISSVNSEQEAALRDLHPEQHYSKQQISYAYQNEAAMMQVENVLSKSINGKTIFVITLKQCQRTPGNSIMDISFFNGYSADKIAELRTRFLLLNELPPASQNKNDYPIIDSLIKGYNSAGKVEKCVFLDLWVKLKSKQHIFLLHARLAAVYHLKRNLLVEHILELKLALFKSNIISVQFRGQRKQASNQEPAIIEVKGNCVLNA